MGTNYYLHMNTCKECGRGQELHIGKSSFGWCFALATHSEPKVQCLDDWLRLFSSPGYEIRNEYGDLVGGTDMIRTILCRVYVLVSDRTPAWNEIHQATRGPNGLARHRIDSFCMSHGGGTYDLIHPDKEFS